MTDHWLRVPGRSDGTSRCRLCDRRPNIMRIERWRVATGAAGSDELLTTATCNALSYTLTLPATTSVVQLYTAAFNAGGGRTQSASRS